MIFLYYQIISKNLRLLHLFWMKPVQRLCPGSNFGLQWSINTEYYGMCGGFKAAVPWSSHDCTSEVWNIRQCYGGALDGDQAQPIRTLPHHWPGHLLSEPSGEAFPTNATRLAPSFILCFTPSLPPSAEAPSSFAHLLHFICFYRFSFFSHALFQLLVTRCWSVW